MTDELNATDFGFGVSISQLAILFRTSTTNVKRKLSNVTPQGFRGQSPVYDLFDAAPYLVKPTGDIEDILRNMRPSDMPASLQKDYWGAQLARQTFEEKAGRLWSTERIQAAFGGMMKMIRQKTMLFTDTVDRQTALTDKQREIVQQLSDSLLEDFRQGVIDLFGAGYNPEGERDEVFEKGPPKAAVVPKDEEIDDGL